MENETMELENENVEEVEFETEKSGNGLKTIGILGLTAAVGTGLYFGAKKVIKKIKDKHQSKTIEVSADPDSYDEDDAE